jgi:hypothetical protein
LVCFIITLIRVKITLCVQKSLVRVEITVVSVVITSVRVKIKMRVEITLRASITLKRVVITLVSHFHTHMCQNYYRMSRNPICV